jgi:hypothetical protein
MELLPIYIPTRGRMSRQVTFDHLPQELKEHVVLVCPLSEADSHVARGRRVLPCPAQEQGLSAVLQWIQDFALGQGQERILTVDDDVILQARISKEDYHLRECTGAQTIALFEEIEMMLELFTLVGVSHRNGNNRMLDPLGYALCERQTNVHGTVPATIKRLGIRYDDVVVQQDFHMTLSLLERGHQNAVLYEYAQSDLPPGTPGGCAIYRTAATMEQNGKRLAELHPGFVAPVLKQTKWKGGLDERWDVRIQWKKCYESSGGVRQ